jgi:uncharacterized protein (DUF2062 family)
MATRRLQGPNRFANSRFGRYLYKPYERFLKIRGNPREIALGFALGLFVGMTPFMGLHMAIAIPLAALFKWNKFSSALAVWITNPLTAPFIYSLTYYVGARLTSFRSDVQLAGIDHTGLISFLQKAPEVMLAMIIGGAVVGLPLAMAGYYFSYAAITKYRKTLKERLAEKKERLLEKKRRIQERLKHK